jgi:hypothetical protein
VLQARDALVRNASVAATELIRGTFQGGEAIEVEEEWVPEDDDAEAIVLEDDDDDPEEPGAEQEAEIARLQEEIAASTRRQQALERYLEALGAPD